MKEKSLEVINSIPLKSFQQWKKKRFDRWRACYSRLEDERVIFTTFFFFLIPAVFGSPLVKKKTRKCLKLCCQGDHISSFFNELLFLYDRL